MKFDWRNLFLFCTIYILLLVVSLYSPISVISKDSFTMLLMLYYPILLLVTMIGYSGRKGFSLLLPIGFLISTTIVLYPATGNILSAAIFGAMYAVAAIAGSFIGWILKKVFKNKKPETNISFSMNK